MTAPGRGWPPMCSVCGTPQPEAGSPRTSDGTPISVSTYLDVTGLAGEALICPDCLAPRPDAGTDGTNGPRGEARESDHAPAADAPERADRRRQAPLVSPGTTRVWLDHHGHLFDAPADARTCRDSRGRTRTHRLWKPEDPQVLVPQTVCGQQAGAIPGEGQVDCPDCLAVEQSTAMPRR